MGRDGRNISSLIGFEDMTQNIGQLPSPQTRRWVARRKAEVVAAVDGGLLSLDEACRRYNLSREEFISWETAWHRRGLAGLQMNNARAAYTAG